jgi:general transcription factor IIIA
MDIDSITGMSYINHANARLSASKALRCPHPHLGTLLSAPASIVGAMGATEIAGADTSTGKACDYVFSRAYDFRRHLRAEHGVDAEKDRVDEWVKGAKARARKGGIA